MEDYNTKLNNSVYTLHLHYFDSLKFSSEAKLRKFLNMRLKTTLYRGDKIQQTHNIYIKGYSPDYYSTRNPYLESLVVEEYNKQKEQRLV